MNPSIVIEPTAHPRAKKFVLTDGRDLRTGAPVTFRHADECRHVPLAAGLLALADVAEAHFAQNVVTITASRTADWPVLEAAVLGVLDAELPGHDPRMTPPRTAPADPGQALAMINRVLDEYVRPYLQSHGGELDLLGYDPETCRLLVNYMGTCGSCPASTSGTLDMIQAVLRDEFDPRIVVEIAGE